MEWFIEKSNINANYEWRLDKCYSEKQCWKFLEIDWETTNLYVNNDQAPGKAEISESIYFGVTHRLSVYIVMGLNLKA